MFKKKLLAFILTISLLSVGMPNPAKAEMPPVSFVFGDKTWVIMGGADYRTDEGNVPMMANPIYFNDHLNDKPLFLLAEPDETLKTIFNADATNLNYAQSVVATKLTNLFDGFTPKEKASIHKRSIPTQFEENIEEVSLQAGVSGDPITAPLWTLSESDQTRLHSSFVWDNTQAYWLSVQKDNGIICSDGTVASPTAEKFARPTFELDKFAFATAAVDGKFPASPELYNPYTDALPRLSLAPSANEALFKLNLFDDTLKLDACTLDSVPEIGKTLTVTYSGATPGKTLCVAIASETANFTPLALEEDAPMYSIDDNSQYRFLFQNSPIYYGAIAENIGETGTATVTIPSDNHLDFSTQELVFFVEDRNGNSKADYLSAPITATVEVEGFTINFDANGGIVTPTQLQTNAAGQCLHAAPTPTRTGYTFIGWFDQVEGGTKIIVENGLFDADTTLYAHWQKNETPANPVEPVAGGGGGSSFLPPSAKIALP